MVPYSLPFQDLTDVKLLPFHDDIGGAGEVDILAHVDVRRECRFTPNEPDWDVHVKEALTDLRISHEGPYPAVESHMKVTRSRCDWRGQIVKHAKYVETEMLKHCYGQDSIMKCKC